MRKDEFITYLKEKNKKHIIFDFDETICTLLIDWNNWIKEVQELFLSYDEKLVEKDFSPAQVDYTERFGKEMRDKIFEINYRNERDYYSGYKVNETAISLLLSLNDFAKIYLWTSNDTRTIMPILEELNIKKFFAKIVTRNDVMYIKPHPEGYGLINTEKNTSGQYILIGDSQADSGAAQNAGIDFFNIGEIV